MNYLGFGIEALRMEHRVDGKIVKAHDDLISATRYASQSLQYASLSRAKKMPRRAISDYDHFESHDRAYA